jgi:Tol biopolymer transport system component
LKAPGLNSAAFSPDGRWIAFTSVISGRAEVFVTSYPEASGRWQVSANGAESNAAPVWSRTRRELIYGEPAGADGRLMAVSYTVDGTTFGPDTPRRLPLKYARRHGLRNFDLHPDGERFVLEPVADLPYETRIDKVVLVFNFFDQLRRAAPATKP